MAQYTKGKAVKLSNNFDTLEFDCKGANCCNKTLIDKQLVDYLQHIRNHFGKPVTITSGYRCPTHNRAVGGVTNSKHTQGMAADIVIDGVAPREVAKYAESIGIKGIGLYETAADGYFTHIDTRANKDFWYGQSEQYRSTFNGSAVNSSSTGAEQNLVRDWQLAAIADGYSLPSGADGIWGAECEAAAAKAVVKRRDTYKNYNLTKFVQKAVGASVDGKCGEETEAAITKYQSKKGIAADGEAGINTYKAILAVQGS